MLITLPALIQNLRSDERAVTALEYGLIASLVAVAIVSAVTTIGANVGNTFNTISSHL